MVEKLQEQFRDVVDFEEYYSVSNLGRVYSKRKGIFLKHQLTTVGYSFVILYNRPVKKNYSIHRMVAIHFIDNLNNYPQVGHKDGCKTNNHVNNLEWCDQSINEINKYKNQGIERKLTKEDVLDIVSLYQKKAPVKDIVKMYDINRFALSLLLKGESYTDIDRPIVKLTRHDLISDDEIECILKLRKKGLSLGEIAKLTKRGKTSVSRIIKREL